MIRCVALFSPSLVLLGWAGWWLAFGRTLLVDTVGILLLAGALAWHTREEIRRRHADR